MDGSCFDAIKHYLRFLKNICHDAGVVGPGSLRYPYVRENVRRTFAAVAKNTGVVP